MRLVPDQRGKEVAALLTKAVKRFAPKYAEVSVKILAFGDPVLAPLDSRPFALLDQACREIWTRGVSPIRSGGSIPIVPLLQQRKAPVLLAGIGLPDDGLHGPNEKLNLDQLWKGIPLFARWMELMGEAR